MTFNKYTVQQGHFYIIFYLPKMFQLTTETANDSNIQESDEDDCNKEDWACLGLR